MGAPLTIPRRLLTLDEYHNMGAAGVLKEDDRIELIEGELIEMAPIGSRHMAKVNWLVRDKLAEARAHLQDLDRKSVV